MVNNEVKDRLEKIALKDQYKGLNESEIIRRLILRAAIEDQRTGQAV